MVKPITALETQQKFEVYVGADQKKQFYKVVADYMLGRQMTLTFANERINIEHPVTPTNVMTDVLWPDYRSEYFEDQEVANLYWHLVDFIAKKINIKLDTPDMGQDVFVTITSPYSDKMQRGKITFT